MGNPEVRFVWTRADRGYYWTWMNNEDIAGLAHLKGESRVLAPTAEATSYVETTPLDDDPSLFLDFAELDSTEESILSFANEHGLLNDDVFYTYLEDESDFASLSSYPVQQLETYKQEIGHMADALELWNLIKEQNKDGLSRVISVEKSNRLDIADLQVSSKLGHIRSTYIPSYLQKRILPHDLLLPAEYLLLENMNRQLNNNPTLYGLRINEDNDIEGYQSPPSLLAALWLQFYKYVTGLADFKQCSICGNWEAMYNPDGTKRHNENWEKHSVCAGRARAAEQYKKKKAAKAAKKPTAKKAKSKVTKSPAKKAAGKKASGGGKK